MTKKIKIFLFSLVSLPIFFFAWYFLPVVLVCGQSALSSPQNFQLRNGNTVQYWSVSCHDLFISGTTALVKIEGERYLIRGPWAELPTLDSDEVPSDEADLKKYIIERNDPDNPC